MTGSKWDTEIKRTEAAVAAINRMQPRPRFVIVGGDIVDAFPGKDVLIDLRNFCNEKIFCCLTIVQKQKLTNDSKILLSFY